MKNVFRAFVFRCLIPPSRLPRDRVWVSHKNARICICGGSHCIYEYELILFVCILICIRARRGPRLIKGGTDFAEVFARWPSSAGKGAHVRSGGLGGYTLRGAEKKVTVMLQ